MHRGIDPVLKFFLVLIVVLFIYSTLYALGIGRDNPRQEPTEKQNTFNHQWQGFDGEQ